jgi:4-amino-4-deoxy-L-arabinose transferase-like glycosyltransferase
MCPSRGSRLARTALEWTGRGRRALRQHWLFAILAVCGTGLRVVVQLAYQQALIFPDSERYLRYAHNFIIGQWIPDWLRTSGYSFLLIPAVLAHNLASVVAVQHLLGLATAVLIYATCLHFGARRWLAALAAIPVLFDPLQLDLEQYILTDVTATFLVTVALVVLVWKRESIGKTRPLVAGLLIAAAALIRESDLLVMIPMLIYLAVVIRPWRRLAGRAALMLVGCVIPVLGYLVWFNSWFNTFNFVTYNSEFMYGRIAQFAECTGLSLPSYEQHLCPQQPPAQRNPDFYMWAKQSPQVTLKPTDGLSKGQIINDFNWRIIKHQPLAYLEVVANDVLYSFSPIRGDGPEKYPTKYHDFEPTFPGTHDKDEMAALRAYSGSGPRVQPALADFLTGYGHDFYVPGPLLAAGLALGLAGAAGIGRARRSKLRGPCLLFSLGTIFLVVPPFIIATFDWRYELPQLSLIPIAAVLGVTALAGWDRDRTPAASPPSTGETPGEVPDDREPSRPHPAETV